MDNIAAQQILPRTSKMIERLQWYNKYQHELLDYRHYFLIDYDSDNLQLMSRSWRRARLTLLDKAHHSYKKECKHKAVGQRVIPQYFIATQKDQQASFACDGNVVNHAPATTTSHHVELEQELGGPLGPPSPLGTDTNEHSG